MEEPLSYSSKVKLPVRASSGSIVPKQEQGLNSGDEDDNINEGIQALTDTTQDLVFDGANMPDSPMKADDMTMEASVIKSTAVVKFDVVPSRFHKLQKNTDLNRAPHNWLRSGSKIENYLRQVHTSLGKAPSNFSSISMANICPDLVDEMDVISNSENIKRLLKIPYTQQLVSMMVHRVGKTLLLDEFDVHEHLLRRQQADWKWLKTFYEESVAEKEKIIPKQRKKARNHLQSKNMFSKFLYYSVASGMDDYVDVSQIPVCDPVTTDSAPEDIPSEFQRTVMWNFEDIRMLIGTDLPIFGGGTRPCVSLRLRDADNPINILTGLDYWLDNLMCNVPELAMCYHLDGIVQKYECIKTEDIPEMDKAKFSPHVIKDVAQNILSFLKTNATKEGHTYWLFKENDSDIVKLYDLSTLCADKMNERADNPFTRPVGMLLFHVARNMYEVYGRKKARTIRTLLKNSLLLLDEDQDSEVVTLVTMLLSDLLVSNNIYTSNTSTPEDSSDDDCPYDEYKEEEEDDTQSMTRVEVKTLCKPGQLTYNKNDLARHASLPSGTENKCLQSLKYVAKGLECVDNYSRKVLDIVTDKELPDPKIPIPLQYHDSKTDVDKTEDDDDKRYDTNQKIAHEDIKGLVKETNITLDTGVKTLVSIDYEKPPGPDTDNIRTIFTEKQSDLEFIESQPNDVSNVALNCDMPVSKLAQHDSHTDVWQIDTKTMLLEKAALAYYGLAKHKFDQHLYGKALKHMKMSLHCFDGMEGSKPQSNHVLHSSLMGLAGDIQVIMSSLNPSKASMLRDDFLSKTECDSSIFESAELEITEHRHEWIYSFTFNRELNLKNGLHCYQEVKGHVIKCVECSANNKDLLRRMGNVLNELGVFYMDKATQHLKSGSNSADKLVSKWCTKAQEYFDCGIEAFEHVQDQANVALLVSNIARLMRIRSQSIVVYDVFGARGQFTMQEQICYVQASKQYKKALKILGSRLQYPVIWDSISWDLSSTYFTKATLLQDHAPLLRLAQEQVETEVGESLTRCLEYCQVDVSSTRLLACQYRAATVHHRLASLYHNTFRSQEAGNPRCKNLRSLAEANYEKAFELFKLLDSSCELLRVQLERVALAEFCLQGQMGAKSKMKTLSSALAFILDSKSSLLNMERQLKEDLSDSESDFREESDKLMSILLSRLQFVLLNIIKVTSGEQKKGVKCSAAGTGMYKRMYSISLKSLTSSQDGYLLDNTQHLQSILSQIGDILQEQ